MSSKLAYVISRNLQRAWDRCDVQSLMLVSFSIQVILTFLGRLRRYSSSTCIRFSVWFLYLVAIHLVDYTVTKLTQYTTVIGDEQYYSYSTYPLWYSKIRLSPIWASLLIVHFAGPDTITAYSLEDCRLWIRNLYQIAALLILLLYIILGCWVDQYSLLSLPLLFAGIIKYVEKTWALSFPFKDISFNCTPELEIGDTNNRVPLALLEKIPRAKSILQAYYNFDRLKPHLPQWFHSPMSRGGVAFGSSSEDVCLITDAMLGFMYDAFFTKAPIVLTITGSILRCFTILLTFVSLIAFALVDNKVYQVYDEIIPFDRFLTYGLLGGFFIVEIYSLLELACSDSGIIWMIKYHKIPLVSCLFRVFAPWSLRKQKKRWSHRMKQFNLVDFCRADTSSMFTKILKLLRIDEHYKMYRSTKNAIVTIKFSGFVVGKIHEKTGRLVEDLKSQELPTKDHFVFTRGQCTLEEFGLQDLQWSVVNATFEESIIMWHVATDICYHSDIASSPQDLREWSSMLSNYMMYLLLELPDMLSITAGEFIFERARTYLNNIFREKGSDAFRVLQTGRNSSYADENHFPSTKFNTEDVIHCAHTIAQELMKLESLNKWELISRMWVDMVFYGINKCQSPRHHIEELRKGGEFITHTWILTTQYARGFL